MKQISSRDNPRFKALRALADDPRETRRQGSVLLDGVHLVGVCVEHGIPLQLLVISETASDNAEIGALLAASPSTEVIQLPDAMFRATSSVATPVGIAGLITLPADASEDIDGDAVILDAVQDAGNVGAILRSAAAAGVRHIVLGKGCAGAWTPRVLRAGQGAHFSLRIREGIELDTWLAERPALAASSLATVAAMSSGAVSLFDLDLRAGSPVAWLFGNEGAGLSPSLVALAGRQTTIPLQAATESLNVAAAAAVCLFEAVRQRYVARRRLTSADS